jgi:hypothetical protein
MQECSRAIVRFIQFQAKVTCKLFAVNSFFIIKGTGNREQGTVSSGSDHLFCSRLRSGSVGTIQSTGTSRENLGNLRIAISG